MPALTVSHSAQSGIDLKEKITSFRIKRIANMRKVQKGILMAGTILLVLNMIRLVTAVSVEYLANEVWGSAGHTVMIIGMLLPVVAQLDWNDMIQISPYSLGYCVQFIVLIVGTLFSLPMKDRTYYFFFLPTSVALYFLIKGEG